MKQRQVLPSQDNLMNSLAYLICWNQKGGLTKFGTIDGSRNRKEWERWARSEYKDELRNWGPWARAYSIPMKTSREAKDWKILMDKITKQKNLKCKHPRIQIGEEHDEWCVSGDAIVNCFNEALHQLNDQTKSL
jgi:hypothetical protein